jgi:hypothetical protein
MRESALPKCPLNFSDVSIITAWRVWVSTKWSVVIFSLPDSVEIDHNLRSLWPALQYHGMSIDLLAFRQPWHKRHPCGGREKGGTGKRERGRGAEPGLRGVGASIIRRTLSKRRDISYHISHITYHISHITYHISHGRSWSGDYLRNRIHFKNLLLRMILVRQS